MQHQMKRTVTFTAVALAGLLNYGYSDAKSAGVLLCDKWHSDKEPPLSPGGTIALNAPLSTSDPTELVLKCPQGVLSYTCVKTPCHVQACANPINDASVRRLDKNSGTEESGGGSFLLSIFKRAPTATISTVVRGEANPNDAVVMLKGDELHLAPALNRILEGNYCFALQSLESSGAASINAKLAWNKDDEPEGIVKVPGLQPGAYVLEKRVAESCSGDPNAVPAWIILAPESQFAELTAKWKSNRAWFDDLASSGNSPAAVATMRHATIAELSQSVKH